MKRTLGRLIAGAVTSVLLVASHRAAADARQPGTPVDTLAPPVCYSLHLGEWQLVDSKGRVVKNESIQPEAYWLPPESILLDTRPPTAEEKRRGGLTEATTVVRPNGGKPPHWMYEVGSWERGHGKIEVFWVAAYVVTTIEIPALVPHVKGTLRVQSDELRSPVPTCEVTLERVACSDRSGPG